MVKDKDKNRPSRSSASEAPTRDGTPTTGGSQQGLAPRSDINALLAGNPGPITDAAGARWWLDSKGWVLAGEEYDRPKMVSVLLMASLLPRVPLEAANAIRAVAYIIECDIIDKTADLLANTVATKVKTDLHDLVSGLTASKTFLEASATQQANTILELKEISTLSKTNTDKLSSLAIKLTDHHPKAPSIPQWPSVRPSQPSLPPSTFDPSIPNSSTRLRQRLLLAARTVLVHVDSNDDLAPP
jgi:hypothetical protein